MGDGGQTKIGAACANGLLAGDDNDLFKVAAHNKYDERRRQNVNKSTGK